MFTDLVPLRLKAGDGGDGRVSFRREYRVPKGGPDGGDGGNGGSIILRAVSSLSTLRHFAGKKEFVAERGGDGGKKKQSGARGDDLILEVPLGTIVWQVTENEPGQYRRLRGAGMSERLRSADVRNERYQVERPGQPLAEQGIERPSAELIEPEHVETALRSERFDPQALALDQIWEAREDGDEIVLCQGGFGGRGNDQFKSSAETTPMVAEFGSIGEDRFVFLELRLLADIGFVGFPNAGKSTLLSRLTSATPKIASYPFTTLEPHVGLWRDQETGQDLVLADIPGLIAGASEGKGLGLQFLRHIKHCKALIFVLVIPESDLYSQSEPPLSADHVWNQYQELVHELDQYDASIVESKQAVLVLNKIDLYPEEYVREIVARFSSVGERLTPISAATGEGLPELTTQLRQIAG